MGGLYVRIETDDMGGEWAKHGSYALVLENYPAKLPDGSIIIFPIDAMKAGFTEYYRSLYPGQYTLMPHDWEPDMSPNLKQFARNDERNWRWTSSRYRVYYYHYGKEGKTITYKSYRIKKAALNFAFKVQGMCVYSGVYRCETLVNYEQE